MFGKNEWFNEAGQKKVLRPSERKGWVYYLTWAGVILVPTMVIWGAADLPRALVWTVFAGVIFFLDYRKILHNKRESEAYQKLFFIGDTPDVSAETEKYEIHLKE